MARYVAQVRSDHPAAAVFDYLSRFETVAEWDPGVAEASAVDPPPVALGRRVDVTITTLGRRSTLRYVVVDLTRGDEVRRVVLEASTGRLRSHDEITVTPDGDGSVVDYLADVGLLGWMHHLDVVLGLGMRRVGNRAAGGLRRRLAEPLDAPPAG